MSCPISLDSLTHQQKVLISKTLTITPKNNKYTKIKPFKCYIIKDKLIYLPFNFYLENFGIPNESLEVRTVDSHFTQKLRDYQEPVYEEAIDILQNNGSVILNLRTGFGKSVLVIKILCEIGLPSLLLYERKIIKTLFTESITQFSNLKYHIVGETKDNIEEADIIICSNRKINKIPPEVKIGVLVVDECHKFCTENNMNVMLSFSPKFCIFLTATFQKDNKLEKIVELIAGSKNKVVFRNDVSFKVFQVSCEANFLQDYKVTNEEDAMGIWNYLLDKQSKSVFRYLLIMRLIKHLHDKKICVLTSRKIFADILHRLLIENNESVDQMTGSKDNYNDSRVLIGTISKIGTGFDEKSCCSNFNGVRINCLIIVSTNRCDLIFEQVVGRGLRSENLEVYSIIDKDSISQKHFKQFSKWALGNCGTIHRFETKTLESIDILGFDGNPIKDVTTEDMFEIEQ